MVKHRSELDQTFAALADPTRREIVMGLVEGERSIGDLAAPFDISLPAISKHLTVLERAGLIRRERRGRVRFCSLRSEPLREALEWLVSSGRFWEASFDSLERLLAQQRKEPG
jgi:DNA-binding transcriptional ArsR family regulator